MSKPTNPQRDRARAGFTPPTLEEVQEFMKKTKVKWPRAFCEWYGEKFFYHYKSNGWKLSSNVPLKDWQAAFYSRWQSLSTLEAREELNRLTKTPAHQKYLETLKAKTEGLFAGHEERKDPFHVEMEYIWGLCQLVQTNTATDRQLEVIADWLRPKKLLILSRQECDYIVVQQGNDANYGKRLAVQLFCKRLQDRNLTLFQHYQHLQTHAHAKTA